MNSVRLIWSLALLGMILGVLLPVCVIVVFLDWIISLVVRSRVVEDAFEKIEAGMTADEVEEIFGRPGMVCTYGDDEFGPPLIGLEEAESARADGRYWRGVTLTAVVRFLDGRVFDRGCLPGNPALHAFIDRIRRFLQLWRIFRRSGVTP